MIENCIQAINNSEDLTQEADSIRLQAVDSLSSTEYVGQVLTPAFIANLMACLFESTKDTECILDPGIGSASLSSAICRLLMQRRKTSKVVIHGYDIDKVMIDTSTEFLSSYQSIMERNGMSFEYKITHEDFIKAGCTQLATGLLGDCSHKYDKIIMNPPYGKIKSASVERKRLREVGVESVNFYAAFMALGIRMLKEGGELVSITPRSFCNGPYYKPLRDDIVNGLSIENICLFDSRKSAFKEQSVLQETVIFHFKKAPQREDIRVLKICGEKHDQLQQHVVSSNIIIGPSPNNFIHITTSQDEEQLAALMNNVPNTLDDLGIQVSTGRVVDFRTKKNLCSEIGKESVPLIYACHFSQGELTWPSTKAKANAILVNEETKKMLDPSGWYVAVKRFSSKEEKKRIVAAAINSAELNEHYVAFDNKTNYFHCDRTPVSQDVANGLAAYLNSTIVDQYFRIFNGHTQVNATDLRALRYPELAVLEELGKHLNNITDQQQLDAIVGELCF